ncbi:MAG: sugar ABC transporter permease [Chloroflexi bacterium]|nr:sugar ABC transporter permease [Chloroflexota bacterium]
MTWLRRLWQQRNTRRGRAFREAITAYLMLAPAVSLIFAFGLWPVLFAVYVSLHRWRIRQGPFVGMKHYVNAIDALAFPLFFVVAAAFFWAAYRLARRLWAEARPRTLGHGLAVLVPASLWAATALAGVAYGVTALPEVLNIGYKAIGQKRTPDLFRRLLYEALHAPQVWAAWQRFVGLFLLALVVTLAIAKLARAPQRWPGWGKRTAWAAVALFFTVLGGIVAVYTWHELQRFAAQFAAESSRHLPLQVASILAGGLLLWASWVVWNRAVRASKDRRFLGLAFAALLLMIGGWVLLAELPAVIAAGDRDVWRGLVTTVYYSAGTVPFQLALGLFFALLLFQNIRGRELFRVIYFMPYITPAVASAAVFRLMFSPRAAGPVNMLLTRLGLPPQRWLMEPRGIFDLLGEAMGIQVPSWAAGPSLALVVIMLYSIWTYVGYDTVIYLAGLGNIPQELKEAAAIDGANQWQIFRYVILPLLSPTTYFLSLIAVIGTFKAFNHIYVMREPAAQGTVDTFSLVIFDEFFTKTRYGYASALAFILFAVILVLTLLNRRIQGSRVFYQ